MLGTAYASTLRSCFRVIGFSDGAIALGQFRGQPFKQPFRPAGRHAALRARDRVGGVRRSEQGRLCRLPTQLSLTGRIAGTAPPLIAPGRESPGASAPKQAAGHGPRTGIDAPAAHFRPSDSKEPRCVPQSGPFIPSMAQARRCGKYRALVEQLVKPVRWSATVQAIVSQGVTTVVECGPGRVLTGLNRRIEKNRDIAMLAIEDPDSLQQALQTVCGPTP